MFSVKTLTKTKQCLAVLRARGAFMGQFIPATRVTVRTQQTLSEVEGESYLNASSSAYIDALYESWMEDPKSVPQVLFTTLVPTFQINCHPYIYYVV